VRAVNSPALREPLRTEYVSRLLGLVMRLDVTGARDGRVAATLRTVVDPPLSTAPPPELAPVLLPPAGWAGVPSEPTTSPLAGGTLTTLRATWKPDTLSHPALARVRVGVPVEGGEILLSFERQMLPSIGAWWLAGPIPREAVAELDAKLSAQPQLDVEAALTVGGETLRWRRCERMADGAGDPTAEHVVDFQAQFGPSVVDRSAYAFTYLKAPRDMAARLALGSDDGCTVWLNGQKVFEVSIGRGYLPRQDFIPVQLQAGLNRLLVRVDQQRGSWALGVHVETPAGEPVEAVEVRLTP
jgi:hypothetical protein